MRIKASRKWCHIYKLKKFNDYVVIVIKKLISWLKFWYSRRPSVIEGLSIITGEILDPAEDHELQNALEDAAQQSKSFHQVIYYWLLTCIWYFSLYSWVSKKLLRFIVKWLCLIKVGSRRRCNNTWSYFWNIVERKQWGYQAKKIRQPR